MISIYVLNARPCALYPSWINNYLATHTHLIIEVFNDSVFDIVTNAVRFLLALAMPLILVLWSPIVYRRSIWHFWCASHIFDQMIWTKPRR